MHKSRWIDCLIALSCFAVVSLHVNNAFWKVQTAQWWLSNLLESFFYFGAPVFFMISGYTLMDYRLRYGTGKFFKKRFNRTVVPFLFWSCCWTVLSGRWRNSPLGVLETILNCSSMPIYWFFIQLFACYLVMPILGLIPDKKKWFGYIIFYSFVSISVSDFLSQILGRPFLPFLRNPIGDGAVTFMLIGYWVGHYELRHSHRLAIYLLGTVAFLAHAGGTYALTDAGGDVSRIFKGYMNWPSFLYSTAVFVWARYYDWGRLPSWLNSVIDQIRDCSLSIYLLHGCVVYALCPKVGIPSGSICYRLFGASVIVAILVVFIRWGRRVPYVKYVLP